MVFFWFLRPKYNFVTYFFSCWIIIAIHGTLFYCYEFLSFHKNFYLKLRISADGYPRIRIKDPKIRADTDGYGCKLNGRGHEISVSVHTPGKNYQNFRARLQRTLLLLAYHAYFHPWITKYFEEWKKNKLGV